MSGDVGAVTGRRGALFEAPITACGDLGSSSVTASSDDSGLEPSPQSLPSVLDGRAFADFHSSYVTGYIQLADAKAGVTFAVTSGVLAFLATSDDFAGAITFSSTALETISAAVAGALLVISSLLGFSVILPRTPRGGDDVIFWKSVAELPSAGDYVARITSLSNERLLSERLCHSFNLSRVCSAKYMRLRQAMLVGLCGLIALAVWWLAAL